MKWELSQRINTSRYTASRTMSKSKKGNLRQKCKATIWAVLWRCMFWIFLKFEAELVY